jgi:hypothetical protein
VLNLIKTALISIVSVGWALPTTTKSRWHSLAFGESQVTKSEERADIHVTT